MQWPADNSPFRLPYNNLEVLFIYMLQRVCICKPVCTFIVEYAYLLKSVRV